MGDTLRVALAEGEAWDFLDERLEQFAERTGLRVDVALRLPVAALVDRLERELAAGAAYHLVVSDSRYTAGLAPWLLPLDDRIPPEARRDFAAPALEMCRWEGRLYQLPRAVETRLLYYRTDLFEDRREQRWFAEASEGRELRVPSTWDELAAIAQYFTRSGKSHGFVFPGSDPWLVVLFAEILTAMGGGVLDADGQPAFDGAAGEWALTLLRDLVLRWQAVPPEALDGGEDEAAALFRLGRCAMICDRTARVRLLCDPTFSAVAGWHSVALCPGGPGGRRAVWTGCSTFAIPATCPEPDAATELLLFLASAETQLLEGKQGGVPARIGAFEALKETLREGTLAHRRLRLAEETLASAMLTAPKLPTWRAIERALGEGLREAILGRREPAEALAGARQAVASLVSAPCRFPAE